MRTAVRFLVILTVLGIMGCTVKTTTQRTEIPNLVGKWSGTGEAIVFGDLQHREKTTNHTFTSMKFDIQITEQKGRVFYGTRSSAKSSENIVGYIAYNNTDIHFVDHDGSFQAKLTDDGSLEVGYLEEGTTSRVAAICVYTKTP